MLSVWWLLRTLAGAAHATSLLMPRAAGYPVGITASF
jgi:hypothetical protein